MSSAPATVSSWRTAIRITRERVAAEADTQDCGSLAATVTANEVAPGGTEAAGPVRRHYEDGVIVPTCVAIIAALTPAVCSTDLQRRKMLVLFVVTVASAMTGIVSVGLVTPYAPE
jgi:hypothetical protein